MTLSFPFPLPLFCLSCYNSFHFIFSPPPCLHLPFPILFRRFSPPSTHPFSYFSPPPPPSPILRVLSPPFLSSFHHPLYLLLSPPYSLVFSPPLLLNLFPSTLILFLLVISDLLPLSSSSSPTIQSSS